MQCSIFWVAFILYLSTSNERYIWLLLLPSCTKHEQSFFRQYLTKHHRDRPTKNLKKISSLIDSPGHVKVSFYVQCCTTFIFCIACESCLFVITNSWRGCLWWCIDFITVSKCLSYLSSTARLLFMSSLEKLKYVGRSHLVLWTELFWIKVG